MPVSIQNIDLTMSGANGSKAVQCPTITPPYNFINVTNLTENIIYLCGAGAVDGSNAMYTFGPYSTLSIPITADIVNSFMLYWETKGDPLLIRTARLAFTYDSLGYNQCYAESFAYAAGKLGITVENTPSVTASIQGTASVNIANTPNVAISSGSVNATIQNAQLNSNITNAMLKSGFTISSQLTFPVNFVTPGVYIYNLGGFVVPAGEYDTICILVTSTINPLSNYSFLYNMGTYSGRSTYGIPGDANLAFTMFINDTDKKGISNRIYVNPPVMADSIALAIKSTTIVNETFNIILFARYASSTIINTSANPGQIQTANGSYDTNNPVNVNPPGSGATTTLLTAGNYVTQIRLSIENTGSVVASFSIVNGSAQIYTVKSLAVGATEQIDITLQNGMINNGIKIFISTASNQSVNGFITTSSATPRAKVSTIS